MKIAALAAVALLLPGALAQEPQTGLKKTQPKPAPKAAGFVTEADAKAVFTRAELIIRKVTKSTAKVSPISLSGNQPISRAKAIREFNRLYDVTRPQIKSTPRPVKMNLEVIKMSGSTREILIKLVKLGAVGNYSTLAAGPADKLTPRDFGDSLGFFLSRMAQMTHTPSSRWSPPLMRDR
ncbi:MAG TPA: hypothetical protein VK934_07440 [Fimbriimonas sp.]|nr:hypothetical protein [Fimbriimonas sp.]